MNSEAKGMKYEAGCFQRNDDALNLGFEDITGNCYPSYTPPATIVPLRVGLSFRMVTEAGPSVAKPPRGHEVVAVIVPSV
jgi:hypothetical protein